MTIPVVTLANGVTMPTVGYGTYLAKEGDGCAACVRAALAAGYRHIDTASIYGNEEAVGQAIGESGVPREEIFVTSKVWTDDLRAGKTKEAFQATLDRLGLDYLDLYLIHWPADGKCAAWLAMEELYQAGKIRAIGLSNFHPQHYDELMRVATIRPMVNQIESNFAFNNDQLIEWCKEKDMAVEVWSPLGGTGTSLLTNSNVINMAERYGKSPAQLAIGWHLQRGAVVLPKTTQEGRIPQNIDVFDFTISDSDMAILTALDNGTRHGQNPDCFNL